MDQEADAIFDSEEDWRFVYVYMETAIFSYHFPRKVLTTDKFDSNFPQ